MKTENSKVEIGFFALFALFTLSFALFYWRLNELQNFYFDESHYITSIRHWVRALGDSNREHPPLGRMIIALSMQFLTDSPFSWRFPSLLTGAWSVVTLGLIGAQIAGTTRAYWITGTLALTSGGLFVFSRIAMLDGIAISFMLFSLYYFIRVLQGEIDTKLTRHAAFYLGLSLATKWLALPFWALFFLTLLWLAIRERSRGRLWTTVSHGLVYPVFIYAIVYTFWLIKTHGFSSKGLWQSLTTLQLMMFETMNSASGDHPYRSLWWEWPKMARPTWFMFEPIEGDPTHVRGILFWVNPFILIFGTLSTVSLFIHGLKQKKSDRSFLILAYLALWGAWFFSHRQLQFFYYYFPAVTLLIIGLGVVLSELRARAITWVGLMISAALFVYYYPILSGLVIEKSTFTKWMWFDSWI